MNSSDFEKENSIKSSQSSRSNSSNIDFNSPFLSDNIYSTESDDENPNIREKEKQIKESFKDGNSMEIESNNVIFSTDSGTKNCPNYIPSLSSKGVNNDSSESSNEHKTPPNKNKILNFDDFYFNSNINNSDESFGSNSSSKSKKQRKINLNQNLSSISNQVISLDDEIEDEIHIPDASTDDKQILTYHSIQHKERDEDIKNCPQKIDESDLTFFTSNKTYMSNAKVEKEEAIIKEPQIRRDTVRKTCKSKPNARRKLTPEEIHAIRMQQLKQYALNFYQLDDPPINMTDDEYDELLRILNEERRKHISERNFTEGDKMNKVISTVMQSHESKKKRELHQQEYNKYLKQHELFLNSLKKFDQETDEILRSIEKKNNEMTEELQKKHDKELSEHYTKWMSESKMRQYNHASQRLLNERKMVETLLNQCRFNEAKKLQASIDEMEKEEEKIAAAQMQHDYEESLKTLNEKQENEENFLRQKCDMKINQTRQRRQIERATFMNKEKKIIKMKEQVSSPDKVWNAMHNQRINQIYKTNKPNFVQQPPRTQQQQQRDNQWRQKDAMSRRRNEIKSLPPMENSEKRPATKQIQQANLRLPATARQPTTSTVIKLPPLKIKKPMKKSRLSHSVR